MKSLSHTTESNSWKERKTGESMKPLRRGSSRSSTAFTCSRNRTRLLRVTAYQASWLKCYYPLEFFLGLFNEQPMGFYNLETLKEDAKRHGIRILNPDVNGSQAKCVIEDGVYAWVSERTQRWRYLRQRH